IRPDLVSPTLTVLALLVGAWAGRSAVTANRHGRDKARRVWLVTGTGAGMLATLGFLAVPVLLSPPLTEHDYAAATAALAGYGALHAFLSGIGSAFALARV